MFSALLIADEDHSRLTVIRGTLTAWTNQNSFTVSSYLKVQQTCLHDANTFIELDKSKITAPGPTGRPVEAIVLDAGTDRCRALVIRYQLLPPRDVRPAVPSYSEYLDSIYPRGDQQVAGTLAERTLDSLSIKLRNGSLKRFQLRRDTKFLHSGQAAKLELLPLGTLVTLRAGRNLDGEAEVFQVVWGSIVHPKP
jgi:hypothetical protein